MVSPAQIRPRAGADGGGVAENERAGRRISTAPAAAMSTAAASRVPVAARMRRKRILSTVDRREVFVWLK
jgi:hypothetical protein